MQALATLKNINSNSCKELIVRNLSRILDIRILDIDLDIGILSFTYSTQHSFEQVKKELHRIGYPIQNYTNTSKKESKFQKATSQNSTEFKVRGRRPYYSFNP
ncbi:hypothetical protein [Cellulophaga sp. Hel_I_12]|uniref:hypothetical protein n=1 Tax=Cellulophaga sp. Hel_I_12 TaxID=1249972 RepID=UPI0006457F45|nr:hypothetical protein [Cellulophaga sp. Hel_I_12]